MKKYLLVGVLVLAMLVSMGAKSPEMETLAQTVLPELTFDGETANCRVVISGPGKEIKATMVLWQGTKLVDVWSDTGTDRLVINGSCEVESGVTYTLRVSGTIGGEAFNSTPISGTCK